MIKKPWKHHCVDCQDELNGGHNKIPDGKLDYQRQPRLGEGPGGEAILKKNQPVRDLMIDEQGSDIVKEIFQKIVSDG